MTPHSYEIGGIGPAGGYIFYDCDADNTKEDPDGADNLKSDVCGWKYLEAASADETGSYIWGGNWRSNTVGTSAAIGTGKANTDKVVATYGTQEPSKGSADYAALICKNKYSTYKGKIYTDWFLPSKYELKVLYNIFIQKKIGNLKSETYLTSTEANGAVIAANLYTDLLVPVRKDSKYHIRAIRAF
jgi:hypothetical protein